MFALGTMVFGGSYQIFHPKAESFGFLRRTLADRVAVQVVRDLPGRKTEQTVAVLRLENDPGGFLTGLIDHKIRESGEFVTLSPSLAQRVFAEIHPQEAKSVATMEDALAVARGMGVDRAVFGVLVEFTGGTSEARLRLDLRVVDRASGQAVFARSYDERSGGGVLAPVHWRARLADSSKGLRILVWVAAALLLPLVTAPIIRRLTAIESNGVNLTLLAAYTLVDVLFALLLTGFWVATLWTTLLLLAALVGSLWYNYRVATAIDELSR